VKGENLPRVQKSILLKKATPRTRKQHIVLWSPKREDIAKLQKANGKRNVRGRVLKISGGRGAGGWKGSPSESVKEKTQQGSEKLGGETIQKNRGKISRREDYQRVITSA